MSGANCTLCSPVTKHSTSHECRERWGTIWLCNLIFPTLFQVLFLHVAGNQRLQTHKQRKGAAAFPPPGRYVGIYPCVLLCSFATHTQMHLYHAEIEPMKTWQAKALLLTHTPAISQGQVVHHWYSMGLACTRPCFNPQHTEI